MKNPARSPFSAVFQTEVLLNTKRVAPYAMAILFAGNALLWGGWGPAVGHGWATNSDFYIAGVLPVYSFLTLPLFTALIMADPVIRDFRTGIAPLIFSKPVSRAQYLLGKFAGNFFVLVCCQAAFVLTLFALQAFQRPGMVVQEMRLIPYLKHFLVFVVISHLVLAAFYFTVGALTRNAKIVYALGVAFYPLYMTWQVALLKNLPARWQRMFDPLLMNWGKETSAGQSAEWANQLVVAYDFDLIANRAVMILIAVICLVAVYVRFAITERQAKPETLAPLSLSTAAEEVYYDSESFKESTGALAHPSRSEAQARQKRDQVPSVPLPAVNNVSAGIHAQLTSLCAAMGVEFRLLLSERSLLVVLPLAPLLAFLSLPFSGTAAGETYSAAYASSTTNGILVFLLGVIVFFIGEAMHRDRELRIEPVLWSTPVSNGVLLLSKFLTTISLELGLILLVGLTAIATQLLRGHAPVDVWAYLITYAVILFPTVSFVAAASIALNVLLREKYFTYATSIAIGGGLFYIYTLGYNHWLYNPALYQLWTYSDLTGAGNARGQILTHRIYCVAVACLFLALAQLGFRRKSAKGLIVNGQLGSKGWTLVVMIVSAALAVATGVMIK
jgi:ABC-type transport system involved in multi-copper enzyme maturation permease subunit